MNKLYGSVQLDAAAVYANSINHDSSGTAACLSATSPPGAVFCVIGAPLS